MQLTDIIIQQIKSNGPMSFHDFMEMALYYPEKGYYTSASEKIGINGDFYTSSNLSPLYGAMIGKQIEEMWHCIGEKEFTIVEYGAGTGKLCYDILNTLRANKKMFDHLRYCIIEKSKTMREREQFLNCNNVSWHESIFDIGNVNGCVISNELVDNFAVHRVIMLDELMEVFVDYKDGFVEILRPAASVLKEYFNELNVQLVAGYSTEINLEATEWIGDVGKNLKKGYVITVDYGFPSCELYSPQRREGTLVCYYKHQVNFDPYINIGYQDITTHINFSALSHWGEKYGLRCTGYTNQADFLLGLGIKERLTETLLSEVNDGYATYKKNTSIVHCLLEDMGRKFKVFVQHKNIPDLPLSGLKLTTPGNRNILRTHSITA
jgi:SAM-dependent MidA family methyltransferase